MGSAVGPGHHYCFEEIAPGVTAGIARPEGTALSNTGVIDLGGPTLLFDTSLTLRSAREIVARATSGPRRGPVWAANSHWHLDHVLGNQLVAGGPIHATRRTIEILRERAASLEKELDPEELRRFIAEAEARLAASPDERAQREYGPVLRLHRALLAEAPGLRLTLPTQGFEGELALPGDSGARLLAVGAGHTESDAVLFLARERIVFAGDLVVVGTHPNLTSGDPESWLTALDRIEALGPRLIVPGHGPVAGAGSLSTMRAYLRALLALEPDGEPPLPGLSAGWEGPEQFKENVKFLRARRARPPRP